MGYAVVWCELNCWTSAPTTAIEVEKQYGIPELIRIRPVTTEVSSAAALPSRLPVSIADCRTKISPWTRTDADVGDWMVSWVFEAVRGGVGNTALQLQIVGDVWQYQNRKRRERLAYADMASTFAPDATFGGESLISWVKLAIWSLRPFTCFTGCALQCIDLRLVAVDSGDNNIGLLLTTCVTVIRDIVVDFISYLTWYTVLVLGLGHAAQRLVLSPNGLTVDKRHEPTQTWDVSGIPCCVCTARGRCDS